MFRYFTLCFVLLIMIGCASISIPSYIQAEHPYKKIVYGDFQEVLDVVKDALKEGGWVISKETHPALYERNASFTEEDKGHVLIFTNSRQSSRLVYSSFRQLNVYVNQTAEGVEIDVRYGGVTDLYLKKIHHYRNDKLVKAFLSRIENKLLTRK